MAVFWKCIYKGMKGTHRGLGREIFHLVNVLALLRCFADRMVGDNGDLFISMNGR